MENSSSDDDTPKHSTAHGHGSYGQSSRVIEPVRSDGADDLLPASIPVHHGRMTDHQMPGSPTSPPPPFTPRDDPMPSPPAPPPSPIAPGAQSITVDPDHPLAVAEVYSTSGIEYVILFISLAVAAISFGSLLGAIVDLTMNKSSGLVGSLFNPYAEAALIVSFPIFVFLFLRLESKEEVDPTLATDSSRRRGMQITLIISFIIALASLISYIGNMLSKSSANQAASYYSAATGSSSGFATFLHALIDITIAGAIFGYYWFKLHKKTGQDLL